MVLAAGHLQGAGLLTWLSMAPKVCVLREREPGGSCVAFLTHILEVAQSITCTLSVEAVKRPTQIQGEMTQPPSLNGGVAKFWNEHMGCKIMLWPYLENTVCHRTFHRC